MFETANLSIQGDLDPESTANGGNITSFGRWVIEEVASGRQDSALGDKHLPSLPPGSPRCNESDVIKFLARMAQYRQSTPLIFQSQQSIHPPASHDELKRSVHPSVSNVEWQQSVRPTAIYTAWQHGQFHVSGQADWLALAGRWIALLVIGQLAAAVYVAMFLKPFVVAPSLLAGAWLGGCLAANFVTYQLINRRRHSVE